MIDPVSEELERRAQSRLPWRPALAAALALHLLTAAAAFVGSSRRHRPLVLPRVQVRIGALPFAAPVAAAPAAGPAAPAPRSKVAPPARPDIEKPGRTVPANPLRRAPAAQPKQSQRTGSGDLRARSETASDEARDAPGPGNGDTRTSSPGGAIAVGQGNGETADFPYGYYLGRALAMIEANWFRPPASEGTRCRVVCRIERTGRLVDAGLADQSSNPAFDRAALRAVYAAAPFPPLPQGYAGSTLTLHLEFGP